MNIKVVGISMFIILLSFIPSISITIASQEEGTLWLRGFIYIHEIENHTVYAHAIRLHYFQWTDSSGSFGMLTFTNVTFPDDYYLLLLGRVMYVIGISNGKLIY
jgi:hypothetical protein